MFSQASVSHSVQGGGGVLTPGVVTRTHGRYSPAPPPRLHGPGILRDTVEKRAVRILLECFLVSISVSITFTFIC